MWSYHHHMHWSDLCLLVTVWMTPLCYCITSWYLLSYLPWWNLEYRTCFWSDQHFWCANMDYSGMLANLGCYAFILPYAYVMWKCLSVYPLLSIYTKCTHKVARARVQNKSTDYPKMDPCHLKIIWFMSKKSFSQLMKNPYERRVRIFMGGSVFGPYGVQ